MTTRALESERAAVVIGEFEAEGFIVILLRRNSPTVDGSPTTEDVLRSLPTPESRWTPSHSRRLASSMTHRMSSSANPLPRAVFSVLTSSMYM